MIYAVAIFLSSFLLFLVQPLVARLILPWFGGSAAVWTTCMLFFQVLLLAGYAYAHLLINNIPREKTKKYIHIVLLAVAVATLPISPAESWKPAGDAEPVSRILLLLCATVGLPYLLLASTSPLLAAWFTQARPGANPYRLFAVSNLASLLALLGYPFLVEPVFTAHQQVTLWSWLFAGFAVICAVIAWRTPQGAAERDVSSSIPLKKGGIALWLVLSATGSALLLAVTNHLTQNVASVPLLWLVPLTLYLATFVIAFEGKNWYRPEWMWSLVLTALIGMAWLLVDADFHYDLAVQLGIFLPGMFLGCLFCHGELYRARPAPERLTAFYLCVSAGGAIGGLLVAVVAPLVFSGYYELGAALVALGALAALRFAQLHRVAQVMSLVILVVLSASAVYDALRDKKDVRVAARNFYGVLRIKEYSAGTDSHLRRLVHGTIMHGEQYLTEARRRELTTYYGEPSGIGAAIHARQAGPMRGPVRVGVIGLGTGTIAAYGRKGDVYRFYDINARVIALAKSDFTYLGDSAATIELALGDARLTLEREKPQNFDVLAVDAFSSDAIPVHLITKEALAVYLRHMKPGGIVAYHVSNRFLDLIPVVARVAKENAAYSVLVRDDPEDEDGGGRSRSDWVLVSKDAAALRREAIEDVGAVGIEERPEWRTWTDDYSNLIQILK